MIKDHSFLFRLIAIAATFTLSACNSKSTTFNAPLSPAGGTPVVKVVPQNAPQPSPSPVVSVPQPVQSLTPIPVPSPTHSKAPAPLPLPAPAPVPAPAAPPKLVTPSEPGEDLAGNYVSADSDLAISATKDFVMHSEAVSSLAESPQSQTLCKIERIGTIESAKTDGADAAIYFNITSEKFSAAQPADDRFCVEVGKSLSESHAFTAPIMNIGKGFFVLKLDEASTDGVSLTKTPGVLSEIFFDQDSNTDLTAPFFQYFSGEFTGALGSYLVNLPIPRLTLSLDSKSEKFILTDNECAFTISGALTVSGSMGSIQLLSPSNSIVTATINNIASKTYSVYYGRLSGGCAQRKKNFISELTGTGIKIEASTQADKYTLDFTSIGGPGSKYTIHKNSL